MSWDITYLLSAIRGRYYYLYLFLDIFSRKIVGAEVYEQESAELSSRLLVTICKSEDVNPDQITVHSDHGGPMKGATMLVTMQKLGVRPSFSRPSVSNDNPYSESMFKTLKYCPQFPTKPFESIEAASDWVKAFVIWYNTEQLHSGINFVTPASKHKGEDVRILSQREKVYAEALVSGQIGHSDSGPNPIRAQLSRGACFPRLVRARCANQTTVTAASKAGIPHPTLDGKRTMASRR